MTIRRSGAWGVDSYPQRCEWWPDGEGGVVSRGRRRSWVVGVALGCTEGHGDRLASYYRVQGSYGRRCWCPGCTGEPWRRRSSSRRLRQGSLARGLSGGGLLPWRSIGVGLGEVGWLARSEGSIYSRAVGHGEGGVAGTRGNGDRRGAEVIRRLRRALRRRW